MRRRTFIMFITLLSEIKMTVTYFLCLFIEIVLLKVSDVHGGVPRRIIGGSNARIEDYPFIVEIVNDSDTHICGGTLISNKHVLTAAHCVTDIENYQLVFVPLLMLQVISGHDDLDNKAEFKHYSVKRIDVHDSWEGELAEFITAGDIAVLTLDEEILGIAHDKLAALPKSTVKTGAQGTIIGWGRMKFDRDSPLSLKLQKANMTVIDHNLCRRHHDPLVSRDALCALESQLNASFCAGDSGGPYLNENGEIIGIISYNWGCTGEYANIFTDVFYHKAWIQEIVDGVSVDTKVF